MKFTDDSIKFKKRRANFKPTHLKLQNIIDAPSKLKK